MKKIYYATKMEVLEKIARNTPNADKLIVDFGRDSFIVQFGQYAKEGKISKAIELAVSNAKSKGNELIIK